MIAIDHLERIDLNCIYKFESPTNALPVRVIVAFYDGVILKCVDCADLKSEIIIDLELFMSLDPIMMDRL